MDSDRMENTDRYVTLVVHTPDRAARLKEILEFHGVPVALEDLRIESKDLKVKPVNVRIPEDSIELGLKILESGQLPSTPLSIMKMTGMGSSMLIPVDFSPGSLLAVKVGFSLARRFNVEPIVLHAFLAPMFPSEPFGEDPENPVLPDYEVQMEEDIDLRNLVSKQLAKFKQQILKAQAEGEIDDVHFSTSMLEGIPEQVIQEYCKQNKPLMVVMATRGIHKKESDLVGSVTAEVIDSCRVPILTVPEDSSVESFENKKNILYFCTLSSLDLVNVRGLMRLFDYPACNVYLLPVSERPFSYSGTKMEELASFFSGSFPTANFSCPVLGKGKFDDSIREFLDANDIDIIIVPNKKSSAFSRFFRPTLAHRILFDKDIPLLVLPF